MGIEYFTRQMVVLLAIYIYFFPVLEQKNERDFFLIMILITVDRIL